MSTPTAREAPSASAAMAKIPDPQPKSSTLSPDCKTSSSSSRHSWVVGWAPVPKVSPGFRYRGVRPSGTGSPRIQSGTMYTRFPTGMG